MNPDRIDELLALAALGELDENDAAELDRALEADADLAQELALDLDVAATIQAAAAEQPRASLKADVLAALDGLEQDQHPADHPGTTTPDVIRIGSAPSRRRSVQTFAAAAAIVVLLAGGLVVFSRTASAPTGVDVVAEADDAIERPLTEGELDGLEVVYSPSRGAFVLIGTDIPVLADAQTYQLWLVGDDGAESVGLFVPDDDGAVSERYDGRDPSGFIVGVTVEPAGGSDTPTAPIRASTAG